MRSTLAPPELAVTTVRTLAIDAVQAANSGHPGAPMGLAPVGWTLFSRHLRHNPADPEWPERDRFVLSAGHASMLLYALLHLTGYDLPMEQLKAFRQLGSETPGHPERADTPGVEITTGPLGQGVANAVGFAIAERMLAARYNRPDHDIVDHRTWFICSDGDLMEGISHEAASIAGFLGLERLIGVWDDNLVSLDGPTSLAFDEDVPARFRAYGWRVLRVEDGNDLEAIDEAMRTAREEPDGRPTLIACRTHIGYGSPNKQDTAAAHGSPLGPEEVAATKRAYGWPEDARFLVPDEVAAWAGELRERGRGLQEQWEARLAAYAADYPHEAAELARVGAGRLPEGWESAAPAFAPGEALATRAAGGRALNAFAAVIPELVQGAADLSTSTSTDLKGMGAVTRGDFAGRNLFYGVREHAMGAITNGIAAHAGLRPVCSTFFTFSDYMKNTIRLAALMRLPSIFVFTHDSVALGEDGPTHQPVEHLAGLRAIPDLVTIRPADARETAQAWRIAIARTGAPTALILSRQGLPTLEAEPQVERGAYVLADGADCILIATGSEVVTALAARDLLADEGVSARVVSMPSFELFREQDAGYRERVLPPSMPARVAVEAASPFGWAEWTGSAGAVVGIDRFGVSAPGAQALEALGITPEAVAGAARGLLVGRPR
ncbi:transketolase [Miltoncostaea marina]|uniref:transketolase n=1 Tax=Miltoncostaea marina TaxID=2843215 RepID=UPI001C3DEADA|nr:transketolase [Miltoncostaea marina]